jgi:hypothetical protein
MCLDSYPSCEIFSLFLAGNENEQRTYSCINAGSDSKHHKSTLQKEITHKGLVNPTKTHERIFGEECHGKDWIEPKKI